LDFKNKNPLEIQKIILTNEDFFAYIVAQTLKQFETIRAIHMERKDTIKIYSFKIPDFEVYSENYEQKKYKKFALTPCYIKIDSKIEQEFMEEYLENENTIEFWYKNGVKTEKCF
jgi:hypothetical protein